MPKGSTAGRWFSSKKGLLHFADCVPRCSYSDQYFLSNACGGTKEKLCYRGWRAGLSFKNPNASSNVVESASSVMNPFNPKVSVGMPVYNGERFVAEALDSILSQTYGDFELIISDNASTDSTEEICRLYAGRDRRIRYFRNPKNLGVGRNFRRTFELSSGEYFKWAAADDLCAPEFLKHCVEVLNGDSSVAIAFPRTAIIDEFGCKVSDNADSVDLQSPSPSERLRKLLLNLGLCDAQYGVMPIRFLRQTTLIQDFAGADICFLAELCLYGKFHEIAEVMFFRRFHPGCSSRNRSNVEVQHFYNPGSHKELYLREWRHLYEKVRALCRAPLNFQEKVRVARLLLELGTWNRRQLLNELLLALKWGTNSALVDKEVTRRKQG